MNTNEAYDDFIDFLDVPDDYLPTKAPKIRFTFRGFVNAANTIAKSVKDNREFFLPKYLAFLPDLQSYM